MYQEKRFYDTIIIGGGPAGLFTAHRLLYGGYGKNIAILEKGESIKNRKKLLRSQGVDIISGIGGAGLFSDGKMCLAFNIGHKLEENGSERNLKTCFSYFNRLLSDLLKTTDNHDKKINKQNARIRELTKECATIGLQYKFYPVMHLGTDRYASFVQKLVDTLRSKCDFYTNSTVVELSKENGTFNIIVEKNKEKHIFQSNYLIIAPGRIGADWLIKQAKKMGLHTSTNSIYIGVRVETLKKNPNLLTGLSDDPKIGMRMNGSHVKTHCFCEGGQVITFNYNGYDLVGGHSLSHRDAPNTNFNILYEVNSKHVEHHIFNYLHAAKSLGNGKPVLQRLVDFCQYRPSSEEDIKKNTVCPSLKFYSTGDLTSILPTHFTKMLLIFLEKLNMFYPGVNDASTLIYAPVVEWCPKRFKINEYMMTEVKNLYVCGDGSGWTQGIVAASMSGILAAEGILKH